MQFSTTLKSAGLFIHPPKRREVTPEEIQAVKAAFYEADEGHKGWLSPEDFKVACLMLLGYKPSKLEVEEIFSKQPVREEFQSVSDPARAAVLMLSSKAQSITYIHRETGMLLEDFVRVMVTKLQLRDEDEQIRRTFLAFDTQCRGFLRVEDLRIVFAQVAPRMSEHVINTAFRELDRDGDGRVSFSDFLFMMKYTVDD